MQKTFKDAVFIDIRLACEESFAFECAKRFPREDEEWLRKNWQKVESLKDIFKAYMLDCFDLYQDPVQLDYFFTRLANAIAGYNGSDLLLCAVIEAQDFLRSQHPEIDRIQQQEALDYLEAVSL